MDIGLEYGGFSLHRHVWFSFTKANINDCFAQDIAFISPGERVISEVV